MPANRGVISRAASALMFVCAAALALAFPGAASEQADSSSAASSALPTYAEWRESSDPSAWADSEVGSFRVVHQDGLRDWLGEEVFGEPERLARELHGKTLGEEKVRALLLDAALGRAVALPDLEGWWRGYSSRYLPELAGSATDALLARGEESLSSRLGFVRSVNLGYDLGLDGGASHGSAEFVGAFRDSADSVLAWQSRGFGGADGNAGGNLGALFRLARDESVLFGEPALFGANVFVDYQADSLGAFWRYSLGGEFRSRFGEVYANYYAPLTGPVSSGNLRRYSAAGFDVKAEVRAPGQDWLSGFWEYYRWRGEFGQADESGSRYGAKLNPSLWSPWWQFELSYDQPTEGDSSFGGRAVFSYEIGGANAGSRGGSGIAFDPRGNFFASARREYGQRIRTATVSVSGVSASRRGAVGDCARAGAVSDGSPCAQRELLPDIEREVEIGFDGVLARIDDRVPGEVLFHFGDGLFKANVRREIIPRHPLTLAGTWLAAVEVRATGKAREEDSFSGDRFFALKVLVRPAARVSVAGLSEGSQLELERSDLSTLRALSAGESFVAPPSLLLSLVSQATVALSGGDGARATLLMNGRGILELHGDAELALENRGRFARLNRGGLMFRRSGHGGWVNALSAGGATVHLLGTALQMSLDDSGRLDFALMEGRAAIWGAAGFERELRCADVSPRGRFSLSGNRFATECAGDGRLHPPPLGGELRAWFGGHSLTLRFGDEAMEIPLSPGTRLDASGYPPRGLVTVLLRPLTPGVGESTVTVLQTDAEGVGSWNGAGLEVASKRTIVLDDALPIRFATVHAASGYAGTENYSVSLMLADGYNFRRSGDDVVQRGRTVSLLLRLPTLGLKTQTLDAAVEVDCERSGPCEALSATVSVFYRPVLAAAQATLRAVYGDSFFHAVRFPLGYESAAGRGLTLTGADEKWFAVSETDGAVLDSGRPPAGVYDLTLLFSHSDFLGELAMPLTASISRRALSAETDGIVSSALRAEVLAAAGYGGEAHRVAAQKSGLTIFPPNNPPGFAFASESGITILISLSSPLGPEEVREVEATLTLSGGANHLDFSQAVSLRVSALALAELVEVAEAAPYTSAQVYNFASGAYAGSRFHALGESNALAVSEAGVVSTAPGISLGESGAVTTGLTVLAYGGSFLGTATLGLSLYVGVSGRTFKASDLDRFYPVRRFDGFRVYALARVPLLTMSSSVRGATLSYLGVSSGSSSGLTVLSSSGGSAVIGWRPSESLSASQRASFLFGLEHPSFESVSHSYRPAGSGADETTTAATVFSVEVRAVAESGAAGGIDSAALAHPPLTAPGYGGASRPVLAWEVAADSGLAYRFGPLPSGLGVLSSRGSDFYNSTRSWPSHLSGSDSATVHAVYVLEDAKLSAGEMLAGSFDAVESRHGALSGLSKIQVDLRAVSLSALRTGPPFALNRSILQGGNAAVYQGFEDGLAEVFGSGVSDVRLRVVRARDATGRDTTSLFSSRGNVLALALPGILPSQAELDSRYGGAHVVEGDLEGSGFLGAYRMSVLAELIPENDSGRPPMLSRETVVSFASGYSGALWSYAPNVGRPAAFGSVAVRIASDAPGRYDLGEGLFGMSLSARLLSLAVEEDGSGGVLFLLPEGLSLPLSRDDASFVSVRAEVTLQESGPWGVRDVGLTLDAVAHSPRLSELSGLSDSESVLDLVLTVLHAPSGLVSPEFLSDSKSALPITILPDGTVMGLGTPPYGAHDYHAGLRDAGGGMLGTLSYVVRASVALSDLFSAEHLASAALAGDADEVRRLLDFGADANRPNASGELALHAGLSEFETEADLNANRVLALGHLASAGADAATLNASGLAAGHVALSSSATRGNTGAIEWLLSSAELSLAAGLARSESGLLPLTYGLAEWSAADADSVLRSGWASAVAKFAELWLPGDACLAKANAEAETVANCLRQRSGDLHALIAADDRAGFDAAPKVSPWLNEADAAGRTPLHHAATVSNKHYMTVLLRQGADVNAGASDGASPVHYAVSVRDAHGVSLMALGFDDVSPNYHPSGAFVKLSDFPYAPLEYAGRLRLESSDDSERMTYAKIILLLRRSGGLCSAALADAAYVDCVSARATDDARRALALVRADDAAGLRGLASAVRGRNESATVFASYRDSDGGNLLHHSARFGATAALTYLLTMTGEDGSTSATVFSERLDLQNTHGASPLHSAVLAYAHGRVWEVASRLLDAGADGRSLMRISPAKWFSLTDESLDGSGSDLALTPLDAALRLLARGSESPAHRRLGAAIIRLNARVARGCTASAESDAYADCALESLLTVPEQDSIMSSSRVAVRRVAAGYLGSVAYFAAGNDSVRWDELSLSAGFGASADDSGLAVFLTEGLSGGASAMGEVDALARLAPYTDTPVALRVEIRALANPVGVASDAAPLSGIVFDFGGQGYANGAYGGASFRKVNGSPELSVLESGLVSVALADGLGVGEYEVAAVATRDDFLGEALLTLKLSAPGRKVSAGTALEVWSTVASAAEGFEGPGWTLVASPGYDLDFESLPAGFALNELSGRRWELELTRPLGAVELGVALGAAVICDAGDCAPDAAVTALATFVPVSDPGQAALRSAYGEAIAHELRLPSGYESGGALRVLGLADYFNVVDGTLFAGIEAPPVGLYTVTVGFSHAGFLGELGLAVGAEVVAAKVVPAEGIAAAGLNPPLVKVAFGHAGEVHRVSPQDSELRFGELPSSSDGVSLALESDDREVVFSLAKPLDASSPELSALFSLTLIRTGGNYQSLSQAVRLRVTTLAEPEVVSLLGEAAGSVLYENAALHDFRAGDYANARFESSRASSALGVSSAGVVSVVSPLGAGDYGLTIAARSADYVGEARLTLSLAVTLALVAEEDSIPFSSRGSSRWVAADYAGSVAFYAARHSEVSLLTPSDAPSGFSFSAGAEGVTLLAEALPGGRSATASFVLTARRSGYADASVALRATVRFVANPLTEIIRPTRAAGDVATLTLSNFADFSDVQYAGASADAPLEWEGATLRATTALSPGAAYYAELNAWSSGFLGTLRLTAKVEAALARFAGRALTRPYDALSPDGNAGAVAIARGVVPERGAGPSLDFPMRYHGVRRGLHVIYLPADDVDAAAGGVDVDGYYRRICEVGGSESGDNTWRLASASEALGLLLDTGRTDLTFCPNASAFSNLPGAPSGYALALPPALETPDAVAAGALPYSELSERGYATDLWAGTGLQVAPSGVCNLERNVSPRHPGALCVSEIAGYAAGHAAPPVGVMILDAVNGTLGVRPGNFRYADSVSVSYAAPFSGELYTVTMRAWRYDYDSVSLESDVSLAKAVLLRGTELRARTEYLSESPGVARVILETESGAVLLGNQAAVLRLGPAHAGSAVELTVLLQGEASADWRSGGSVLEVARGDRFSSQGVDVTYLGPRRGLHMMRVEGVHPAEIGAGVCAAGRTSRTAWRLPGLAELSGLYLEGSEASAGRALGDVAKFGTAEGIAGLRDGLRFGLGSGAGSAPAVRGSEAVYGNVFDGSGRVGMVFDDGTASATPGVGGSHYCVAPVAGFYAAPAEPAGLRLSVFGSGREVVAETTALSAEARTYVGWRAAVLTVRVRAWRWGSDGEVAATDSVVSLRLDSGREFGLSMTGSRGIFTVMVSATLATRPAGSRLMTVRLWPSAGATAALELSVDVVGSRSPLPVVFSSTVSRLTAAAGYAGPLFTVTGTWSRRSDDDRPDIYTYEIVRGPAHVKTTLVADPDSFELRNLWGEVRAVAPGLAGGLLATVEVRARGEKIRPERLRGRFAEGLHAVTLRSLAERPLTRHPLVVAAAPVFHATLSISADEHPGPFSFADASDSDSELRIAEVDGRGVVSLANPSATLSGGTHTVVARATAAGLLGAVMFTVEVPVIGAAARFAGATVVSHGFRRGLHYVSSAREHADASELGSFCARGSGWRPASLSEFMGLFAAGDSAALGAASPEVVAPGFETGYVVPLSPLENSDSPPPSFARGYPNLFLTNDSSSGALLSTDDFRLLNGASTGGRLVCVLDSSPPRHLAGAYFSNAADGRAETFGRVLGTEVTLALQADLGHWTVADSSDAPSFALPQDVRRKRIAVSLSASVAERFGFSHEKISDGRALVSVWRTTVAASSRTLRATLWAQADATDLSESPGPRARYVAEFRSGAPPRFAGVELGGAVQAATRTYTRADGGGATVASFSFGGLARGLYYVHAESVDARDAANLCAVAEGWRAPNAAELAGLMSDASARTARLADVAGADAGEWMPGIHRRPDDTYAPTELALTESSLQDDAKWSGDAAYIAEHYFLDGGAWLPAELSSGSDFQLSWDGARRSNVVCVLEDDAPSYSRPAALSGLRVSDDAGRELGRSDESSLALADVYFAGRGAALFASRYYYGPDGAPFGSDGALRLENVSGPGLPHYAIRPEATDGGLALHLETLENSARETALTLGLSGLALKATLGLSLLPQNHTFGGVARARFPLEISHPESGAVAALTLGGFLEHDGLYWLFSDGALGEGYAAAICAAGADDNFAWRAPRLAELMRLQGVTILSGAGSGLAGWRSGLRIAEGAGVSESPVRIAWLDLHRSDGLEALWSLESRTVQEYDQASGLTAHAACVAPSSSAYVSPPELAGARLVPSGFFLSGTTLTASGLGTALLTAHAESWRWDSRGRAMAIRGEGRSSIRFASGNATLHSFSFADSFGTVYAATAALVYNGDRTIMRWNNPGTLPESGATLTLSAVPPFGAATNYAVALVDRERLSADGFLAETPARRAVAAGYAGPVLRIQAAAEDDSIGAISADLPHPLTLSGETIALSSGLAAGSRLIATLTVEARSPNRLAALAEQVLEVSSLPSFGVVSATTASGIADVFVTEIGGALLASYPEARFAFHAGAGFDVSPLGIVSATAALEAGRIFEAVAAATVAGSAANVFLGTILLTAEVTTRAAADSVLFNHRPFYAGEANEFGLVYHGPRRGMQVAYSESDVDYGDANPISFCAAGSAEGWRAPSPSEYAALFSDARSSVGATLRVARKAGVARIHAGFGAALSLTMPRSRNGIAPSFSRGYADFYVREDGRTTALPIEIDSGDNFVAGRSETGRLICVLGPDTVSHPRGVAALWLDSGGVETTTYAGGYSDTSDSFEVPTMTAAIELAGSAIDFALRAWRPHETNFLLESALVPLITLPESNLFLLSRTVDGFRVAAKNYDTGLGRSERFTLAFSSPDDSSLTMTILVYATQPEAVFRNLGRGTLIFTTPGQVVDGVRYVGHRRGAR